MDKPRGVAFKVTYNDNDGHSAPRPGLIGFRGVCSDATILMNVRDRKMTNCSDDTKCARYVESGLRSARPRLPSSGATWCYEAALFARRRWEFGSGAYHRGAKVGQPIPMEGGQPGDLVALTTRFPGQSESERSVFALYRVGKRVLSPDTGLWIRSDGTMQILLDASVAQGVRYWDYAEGDPDWRMGLFRYLSPEATLRLLSHVAFLVGDGDERDLILKAYGSLVRPTEPTGSMHRFPRGGEGEAHRRLKHRVAQNPTLIGLPASAKAVVERGFISGDRVDIAFELPRGRSTVVEVETYS